MNPNNDVCESDQNRDIQFSGRYRKNTRKLSNRITSSQYKLHYFFSRNLREQFKRPLNSWLLILSIIEFSIGFSEKYFLFITILPFAFLLLLSFLKEAIYSYKRYLSDNEINNAPSKVWDGSIFREISTAEIEVGDFVLLYNKERVPADMILFCTGSSDNKCFVDSSGILDEKDLMTKFPVEAIRFQLGFDSLSDVTYKLKHVKGIATVPVPSADFSNFEGKIRLKVSPSSSRVRMKNLLLRDSQIMNTTWVIGLVVYTGNETKAWISSTNLPHKISNFERYLNKLSMVAGGVILVLAGICTALSKFVAQNQSFSDSGQTFLHFLLEFSVLVPWPMYAILGIVRLLRVLQIQKECKVSFQNGGIVDDLGSVEYILADKSGTITEKYTNASKCLLKNTYYNNIEDLIDKDSSVMESKDFVNKDPEVGDFFSSQEFLLEKEHFIRCLAVCNKGYTNNYGESYLTKSGDERVLINTAMILGTKLVKRSEKALTLLKENTETHFNIIGCQSMSRERNKGHIILQSEDKSQNVLYVIGSVEAMNEVTNFLQSQDEENIETITSNKKSGIRQLVCAYKEMTSQEILIFVEAYHKAKRSPVNRNGRVESLFEEIEENCKYLGLIGLEETVNLETRITVTALKHAGIKIWMLSGDSFESSLSAGLGSGIVDDTIPLISIHDTKTEDEFIQVADTLIEKYMTNDTLTGRPLRRSSLTVINEPLSYLTSEKSLGTPKLHTSNNFPMTMGVRPFPRDPISKKIVSEDFATKFTQKQTMQNGAEALLRGKNIHPLVSKVTNIKNNSSLNSLKIVPNLVKYTLFIDAVSLDFGLKSEESIKKLVMLMFCSNSICFTSLLPSHKTKIAEILAFNFGFKPVFIGVGDGGSDVGLIKTASIGIGIQGQEGNQAASASEVVIQDFSDLRELILNQGFLTKYTLKKSLFLGAYAISSIFTFVFLMNFMTDYSGEIFLPHDWYVSYYLVFSIFPAVIIGIYDNKISLHEIEKNLKMYCQESLKKFETKKLGFYLVLGGIHSGVTVFVYNFGFYGQNDNILEESVLIFICMIVSLSILSGLFIKYLKIASLAGPFISLVFAIIMIIIQSFSETESLELFGALQIVSSSPSTVIHIFMLILIHFSIDLAFLFWQQLFSPEALDYFQASGFSKFSLWVNSRFDQFSTDIKGVFTVGKASFEKNIVEPSNFSKWTLNFISAKRQKKFLLMNMQENRKRFAVIFGIMVILMISLMPGLVLNFSDNTKYTSSYSVLLFIFCVFLILTLFKFPDEKTLTILKILYILSNCIIIIASQLIPTRPIITFLYPLTFILCLKQDVLIVLICTLLCSIAILFSGVSSFSSSSSSTDDTISVFQYILLYVVLYLHSFLLNFITKYKNILEFNLIQKAEEEYEKVTEVLDYLLPMFVRKRVKDGVRYIAEDQGEVTVLFCYIVGFEKITAEYSIEELTTLLDELFGKIDSLCELVGVSKIETVGNTYMACSGLRDSESEIGKFLREIPHARRAIELGFAILRAASQIRLKNGEKLVLKIGINSGRVTAGVVGFHKPQFSLVGDTVNTASRMASSAEKNTIQISKATYDLVGESKNFNCKMNFVDIKGKGKMETYTITLHQMELAQDTHIEKRISLSYSSIGGASFAAVESDSPAETERNLLNELQIFGTSDFFGHGEGHAGKMKFFKLPCKESVFEKEFRQKYQKNMFWIYGIGMILKQLSDIGLIISIFIKGVNDGYVFYILLALFIEITLLSVMLVFLRKKYETIYFHLLLNIIYLIGLVLSMAAYIQYDLSEVVILQVFLQFQLLFSCTGLIFSDIILISVVLFLIWILILITKDYSDLILSQYLPCTFYYVLLQIYLMYYREQQFRIRSNLSLIADHELKKTEKLLTQMIPAHVYKHLKEENTVTDFFFQVTVIYADIVGFTPWSSGRDAEEIVNMLSMLFTRFDESSVLNKVYKVHTIGDCYVAMGYHGSVSRDAVEECENMINFAYSMLEIIQEVSKEHKQLNMRIGLHTGDIIGGIMGTSIVRYDIYGTDVLVANQMESNGIPGKIVISETTKQFLEKAKPDKYRYNFHTEVRAMDRNYKAFELLKVE